MMHEPQKQMSEAAQDVLQFWFGAEGDPSFGKPRQEWFRRDASFDAAVRERFADLHAELAQGGGESWLGGARSTLAFIIVLDQFSRNLYRDDARAFAADPLALRAAELGISSGFDRELTLVERPFLYMPFMHSETLADQDRCVALFEELAREDPSAPNLSFALRHREIVARFGRFPHRNRILGRTNTPEEQAFLLEPNSSF
ncbi:MAG TPA: DUF924 family protein [Polyangiaceae bacterium]|nr:DUF924 family protein [Polyangiaceae bacterium]